MDSKIHVFPDLETLSSAAAERWVMSAGQAVAGRNCFHIALTGGSTPQHMYRCLAQPEFSDRVAWDKVHIYFGDERSVPPEHPDSNYGMAHEALLRHVPIPAAQIHRMEAERSDPAEGARAYAEVLALHLPFAQGTVQFDLLLLGIGTDGHVASLFPGTPILQERLLLAAAVHVDKLQTWRLSLTLPVINNAKQIMMLASGKGKADIIGRALAEEPNAPPLPVQMLQPISEMQWYLDEAAAQRLSPEQIS